MAAFTRKDRLAMGNGVGLNPWVTPGQTSTNGQPAVVDTPNGPGIFICNALLQLFGSGATGFNINTADGFVDMGL
jgi:hypothetical protein